MISTIPFRARLLFVFGLLGALAACATSPPPASPEAPIAAPAVAEPAPVSAAVLRPDYPQRYTVVKGDTLWDIAARFLKDPWKWPQVWHINPDIANPHLIYPGDVIVLYFGEDGRPVLALERDLAPKGLRTVKLSPQVRTEALDQAVSTLPLSSIGPFLSESYVVSREELEKAPYIVSSFEEHLMTGAGNVVYARGVEQPGAYTVVRAGEPYRDPDTGRILGYEAVFIGEARVTRMGEPATLFLSRSRQEALLGDRLLPEVSAPQRADFIPKAPPQAVTGRIIDVLNGLSQIGQHQTVVLDRGHRHGLEPGHVLAVYQSGVEVRDPLEARRRITLPDERAGVVMVFRSFEQVSYALVMEATRPMHVRDRVTNP